MSCRETRRVCPYCGHFLATSAIYCLTPTTEEIARAAARGSRPAPVSRFELPAPQAPPPALDPDPRGGYFDPDDPDHDDRDLDDEDEDDDG
jgi:hypothetical protein